jgi:NAD(P)-dependent dehydrogenase (short-subunit alcohol dehydrogenase family)
MGNRLTGRTALVTGATSGIGRAIAVAFAAEGAYVIVSGRDAARGASVVDAIVAAGGRADFLAADLGEGSAAVLALADAALRRAGGRLDVLVNNAAHLIGSLPTVATDPDLVDRALAVSVKAPFLLTAALAPAMLSRGAGVIINIGSINGLVGMRGAALYGASKAALHSLTKSWAAEFAPAGVRVNTIAPGPTSTERNATLLDGHPVLGAIPSGRMSTPAEVAAAAVFLASDEAANIHGSTLSVDGGFTSV